MGGSAAETQRFYVRTLCDKPSVQRDWVAVLKDKKERASTFKPGCDTEEGILHYLRAKLEAQVELLYSEKRMTEDKAKEIIGDEAFDAWKEHVGDKKPNFTEPVCTAANSE